MTYKISMQVSPEDLENLINQLPNKDKVRLANKLVDLARQSNVRDIIGRVDARKGPRPGTKDILNVIHSYRRKKHD